MKPQQKKSSAAKRRAAEILGTLAETLPDQFLQEHFSDQPVTQVREALREAAGIILSETKKSGASGGGQVLLGAGSGGDWQGKLQGRFLYLYTDGAARGNPGEAGAGAAIFDDRGNELAAEAKYLGRCTNNEAEYRALLLGLAKCAEFGSGSIKVHLDSELIVRQIRGESGGPRMVWERALHILSGSSPTGCSWAPVSNLRAP